MKIQDDFLNKVSIKIKVVNNAGGEIGSGVIFTPFPDSNLVYIVTAKHCVFGKDLANEIEPEEINVFYEQGTSLNSFSVDIKNIVKPPIDDFCLLWIEKSKIASIDVKVLKLTNSRKEVDQFLLRGYPGLLEEEAKKDLEPEAALQGIVYFSGNKPGNTHFRINPKTFTLGNHIKRSPKSSIEGLSGSGIIKKYKSDYYLTGIIEEITVNDGIYESIDCVGLSNINSLLNEKKLPEVKFEEIVEREDDKSFIESVFKVIQSVPRGLLPNIDFNVSEIQSTENNLITEIVKKLISSHSFSTALSVLEEMRQSTDWESFSTELKYLITANIGVCKLSLGEEKRAAIDFIKAQDYKPNSEKSLCNAALGFLFLKMLDDARNLIKKALEINPKSTYAYSIYVQTYMDKSMDFILSLINDKEILESSDVAYALGFIELKKNNYENSKYWLEIALEKDNDKAPEIKGLLGQILISLSTENHLIGHPELIEHLDYVQRAYELLADAWKSVSKTDQAVAKVEWLAKKSIAGAILGKFDEALKDIDYALSMKPDYVTFKKHKVMILIEGNRANQALELSEELLKESNSPELNFLYITCLTKSERNILAIEAAIKSLKVLDENNHDTLIKRRIEKMILILNFNKNSYLKDRVTMELLLNNILKKPKPDIHDFLIIGKIYSFLKNKLEAEHYLKKAKDLLEKENAEHELLELADSFYYLDLFSEAISLYEKLIKTYVYGELTKNLFYCYLNNNQRLKALALYNKIKELSGINKQFSLIEANILLSGGFLHKAKAIYEEVLGIFQNDIIVSIKLCKVYKILNEEEKYKKLINSLISFNDFDNLLIEEGIELAYFYLKTGNDSLSLNLAYNLRRIFFNDPRIHHPYLEIFYTTSRLLKEKEDPETVSIDCVFEFEDSTGFTYYCSIVEQPLLENEILLSSEFAQKVLSKGKEEIFLNPDLSIGKIKNIFSKFNFATKVSNSKEQINSLNGRIIQSGQTFDIIKYWFHVIHEEDSKINWGYNSIKEVLEINELIDNSPPLLIDVISLLTLESLNLLEIFPKVFNKIYITYSSIRYIQQSIYTSKFYKSMDATIFNQNKNVTFNPVELEEQVNKLEGILEWVYKNCEVASSESLIDKNYDEFKENIPKELYECIQIAKEKELIFYTDQHELLKVLKKEDSMLGVWTQPILEKLYQAEAISKSEFYDKLFQLILMNYRPIYFNIEFIFYIGEKNNWKLEGDLKQVLDSLKSYHITEINYVITLVRDLLFRVLENRDIDEVDKNSLASFILNFINSFNVKKNAKVKIFKNIQANLVKNSTFSLDTINSLVNYFIEEASKKSILLLPGIDFDY